LKPITADIGLTGLIGVAVTLDGFIEGPNGEYDWCFTDQDYGMQEFLKSIDATFYGRKSYEMMQTYGGPEGNPFKGIKSYVFSRSWKGSGEDYELVSGDVIAQVKRIKQSAGKDIWLFGGASLTSSLMNAHLVDELWLSVHPILLGAGKALFSGIEGRRVTKLVESKVYETGLVSLRYSLENNS
jgi:dihydrofolate reductase